MFYPIISALFGIIASVYQRTNLDNWILFGNNGLAFSFGLLRTNDQGLDDVRYTLYPGPLGIPIGSRFQAIFALLRRLTNRLLLPRWLLELESTCWHRRTFRGGTIATDVLLSILQMSLVYPIDRPLMFQHLSNVLTSMLSIFLLLSLFLGTTNRITDFRPPVPWGLITRLVPGFCSWLLWKSKDPTSFFLEAPYTYCFGGS